MARSSRANWPLLSFGKHGRVAEAGTRQVQGIVSSTIDNSLDVVNQPYVRRFEESDTEILTVFDARLCATIGPHVTLSP